MLSRDDRLDLREFNPRHDQVALPLRIGGIAAGQRFGDSEGSAEGRERAVAIALRPQHVADLVVTDREVALPLRIGGIAASQRFGYSEGSAEGRERAVAIA